MQWQLPSVTEPCSNGRGALVDGFGRRRTDAQPVAAWQKLQPQVHVQDAEPFG